MANKQRTVLITGTSSGVGAALALRLAKNNYHVFATMRDLSKGKTLQAEAHQQELPIELLQLDVQNSESIKQCVEKIIQSKKSIDILVNNAGLGFIRTTEQASMAEVKEIFDINLFGLIETTKAVLPYMRAQKSGHIINLSSIGGLVGQPLNEIYCAAKFAVEGYTESLASYMPQFFGIHCTLIEPGGIATEFAKTVLSRVASSGGVLEDPYKPVVDAYLGNAQKRAHAEGASVYQSADEVAQVIQHCIEQKNPPLRVRTSPWAEDLCSLKTSADPDGLKLANRVYQYFLGK